MAKTRKYLYLIFLLGSVVFVGYCVKWFYSSASKFSEASKESMADKTTLSDEYLNIFNDSIKSKLHIVRIKSSKNRDDIAILKVDSNFVVLAYRLSYMNISSLRDIINYKCSRDGRTANVLYHGVKTGPFQFDYASGHGHDTIKNIIFTFNGDITNTIIGNNDSTINYPIIANKATIGYKKDGIKDIYIEAKGERKVPMDILFMRRNKNIFVLIAASINKDIQLPPQLLLSFLK